MAMFKRPTWGHMNKPLYIIVAFTVFVFCAYGEPLEQIVVGSGSDAAVRFIPSSSTYQIWDLNSDSMHIGNRNNDQFVLMKSFYVFELPEMPPNSKLDKVQLSLTYLSRDTFNDINYDVDLIAVRYSSADNILVTDYNESGTLIQESIINLDLGPHAQTVTSTDSAEELLADWILDQYDAGALAGDYIILGLVFSEDPDTASINSYRVASANHAIESYRPSLLFQYTPLIYFNDFSEDPSDDFTFFGASISYDYSSEHEVLEATRSDSLRQVGAYQLVAENFTNLNNKAVQTSIDVTIGNIQNNYAIIGGVYGRINSDPDNYLQGYYAVLGQPEWDNNDPNLKLFLGRDMGTHLIGPSDVYVDMGTILKAHADGVVAFNTYVIELIMDGDQITAKLWDENKTTLLRSITATDDKYTHGNAGYLTALRSGTSKYTYDNFSVYVLDHDPSAPLPAESKIEMNILRTRFFSTWWSGSSAPLDNAIAYEPFLIGLNESTGEYPIGWLGENYAPVVLGWTNSWVFPAGQPISTGINEESLSISNIASLGGSLTLKTSGVRVTRPLSFLIDSGDIYISVLMQLINTNRAYRAFELHNNSSADITDHNRTLQIGVSAPVGDDFPSRDHWGVRVNNNVNHRAQMGVKTDDVTHFVIKLEYNEGDLNDRVLVWKNPNVESSVKPEPTVELSGFNLGNAQYTSLARFGESSKWITFDEIRIGETWRSVLPLQ